MTPAEPELRSHETIRAYLEELARLKTRVQFWIPRPGALPFETTVEQVGRDRFTTATTPALEGGQILNLAFMLLSRRFVSQTQAEAPGVFRMPISLRHGERRAWPRGPFGRDEKAEVLAVERVDGVFPGGRTLQGRLLDLSEGGLRLSLDEFDVLTGPVAPLRVGDRFAHLRVGGLSHAPDLVLRGRLAHLTGLTAGFETEGLSLDDLKNLERILAPRYPATFGQAFPVLKRKTDLADRPGAPTPTRVKARPPEVVEATLALPPPEPEPVPPPLRRRDNPVLRLRKAARRVLLLSAQGSLRALAEAFREDGFRWVVETRTFRETQEAAEGVKVDLVVLDNTMSGYWGKDMMKLLNARGLLLGVPVVLVVECRNEFSLAIAEALDAVHVHERRAPYEALAPVVQALILEEGPQPGAAGEETQGGTRLP